MKQFILIIITVCLLLGAQTMFSQSASEDSKGDPITFPHPGGQVNVNITTNTIKIEELFRLKDNWLLGFAVSGKANNGIASILNTGSVSPGAKFSLDIGYSSDAHTTIKTVNEIHQLRIPTEDLIVCRGEYISKEILLDSIENCNKKLANVKNKLPKYYVDKLSKLTSLKKEEIKALKKMEEKLKKDISCYDKYMKNEPLKKAKQILSQAQDTKAAFQQKDFKKVLQDFKENIEKLSKAINIHVSGLINILNGKEIPKDRSVFNLNGYYEVSKFKFFDPDQPFDQQISEETFKGAGLQLSYSYYLNAPRLLVTFGAGIKHDNNVNTLRSVTMTETTKFTDSTGDTTRTTKKEITALKGALETFTTKNVLFSAYWKPFPGQSLSVAAYARYGVNLLKHPLILGLGAFLGNKENSFKPIAGIVAEYEKDLKSGAPEIPVEKRFRINLMLSLPFKTPSIVFKPKRNEGS